MFCLGQGGGVTFCWTWLDAAEADGEFSRRSGQFANRPYGGGGSRLGGGVRLQEGWVPASAGMTGGGVGLVEAVEGGGVVSDDLYGLVLRDVVEVFGYLLPGEGEYALGMGVVGTPHQVVDVEELSGE